jgi:hypothetical protein
MYRRGCVLQLSRSGGIAGRVLLAAGTILALAPTRAFATFPGGDGVVAYAASILEEVKPGSAVVEPDGLWAVDPGTGWQRQLTSGDDTWPSFSPSGNMLAFQRGRGAAAMIYVARADGADPTALTSGEQPAFSPGGHDVVFARSTGLFVTGVTPGSKTKQLTSVPGDSTPQWGSTGEVVFQRVLELTVTSHGKREHEAVSELAALTPPSTRVHTVLKLVYAPQGPATATSQPPVLLPQWYPDGTNVSLGLCESTTGRSPSVTLVAECKPRVPDPHGEEFAEPGAGLIKGHYHGCPEYVGEQAISWQPVLAGTIPISTRECRGPRLGSGALSEVKSSTTTAGEEVCLYSPRLHRTRCHTVGQR